MAFWKSVGSDTETKLDYNTTELLVNKIYGDRYQILKDAALSRIDTTNDYYDYFGLDGQYWQIPHAMGYKPTVMPVNLARWFIKKRASWLFGVAPDVECPPITVDSSDEMETVGYEPSEGQKMADSQASERELFIYDTWTKNKFEEKLFKAAQDYYIGGTVALKLRYLPGNRGIRLNFSPCQEVFPVPNPDDPDIYDEVTFASFYDNNEQIWMQKWEMIGEKCYLSEGIYDLKLEPLSVKYNREYTRLNFMPVYIFLHAGLSGDIFGTSYLKDLIPLFDQFSHSMSDAADSLKFNLFAVTVLVNAPPKAEQNLKISPGEIWNISGDDGVDVKKLESSFQYAAALDDFLTRLENMIHLIGDVPDITPDRIKGFGLVSGVALKLLFANLIDAAGQDQRIWKPRMVEANEGILRMADTFKIFSPNDNYSNRIIFHLPLPENEVEKVQIEAQKLGASLQSIKGALQELGDKYPERTIARILTEKERFLKYSSPSTNFDPNQQENENRGVSDEDDEE